MKRICVFCGTGTGIKPEYSDAATELGYILAEKNIGLVYGGSTKGIMGKVSNAVLEKKGEVIGVIAKSLEYKEKFSENLTETIIADSFHDRKVKMEEISDGFIALPGGMGTIEELTIMLTWAQLGFHKKPVGLLNPAGYWDKLIDLMEHIVAQGFMKRKNLDLILVEHDPRALVEKFISKFKLQSRDELSKL